MVPGPCLAAPPPPEITLKLKPVVPGSALAALITMLGCSPGAPSPAAPEGTKELRIVAHEDDDLLFMNPDLAESIEAGRPVRTVFVTAGDAGKDASYWRGRESGILEAYAKMAGVPDDWETGALRVAGRTVELRTLTSAPQVSLVFLRLPDGNGHGAGFSATDFESLAKLWNKSLDTLHPLDGSPGYTKKELVRMLLALMTEFHAQIIDTQDYTGHFAGDHSDHITAAHFAHAAERRYRPPHATRVYRGYNQLREPQNLIASQQGLKEHIFLAYASHDLQLCAPGAACKARADYPAFLGRQYPYIPGSLLGPGGKCLESSGRRVVMRTCRDHPAQQWSLKGGRIESALGGCLTVEEQSDAIPVEVTLEACTGDAQQAFALGRDGHLQMADGSCATLAAGGPAHGPEIFGAVCGSTPSQTWRLYPADRPR